MSKAFATYGFELTDPETDVKLNIPHSFKATFNYKLPATVVNSNLENATEELLSRV
jgi:hypothetical protein